MLWGLNEAPVTESEQYHDDDDEEHDHEAHEI
jgi:hypothetical protein